MPRVAFALLLLLAAAVPAEAALPERLADTGFGGPGLRSFEPRFALWSDGAAKQRWIALPPGTAVDASQPDAWRFPAGTRLWKTFSVDGRPVETRHLVVQADGRVEAATYVWHNGQARRAPDRGPGRCRDPPGPAVRWVDRSSRQPLSYPERHSFAPPAHVFVQWFYFRIEPRIFFSSLQILFHIRYK